MFAYWKLITTPLIGAVIGYATTWVAVKMLFRPQKEVRLFGRRLPFTPGVIPKGKARLARAVGRAVEEQLLTREVLQEVLLSEEKKEVVRKAAADMLERQKMSQETLWEAARKAGPAAAGRAAAGRSKGPAARRRERWQSKEKRAAAAAPTGWTPMATW